LMPKPIVAHQEKQQRLATLVRMDRFVVISFQERTGYIVLLVNEILFYTVIPAAKIVNLKPILNTTARATGIKKRYA
jgi:hypothetical protein